MLYLASFPGPHFILFHEGNVEFLCVAEKSWNLGTRLCYITVLVFAFHNVQSSVSAYGVCLSRKGSIYTRCGGKPEQMFVCNIKSASGLEWHMAYYRLYPLQVRVFMALL